MSIDSLNKQEIINKFKRSENDTGSAEVQIALLTERIKNLTAHMQQHKHDYHSLRGLMCLVGKRRKLLKYLSSVDFDRYSVLIKALEIRK